MSVGMSKAKTKTNRIKKPISGKVVNVPVVMQMEMLECGAAALAMVLAYYDKWIPLEQVRLDCGVSRDGSKASNVVAAARNYGLTTKAYRLEPDELKKNGTYPCIIHWNFNHFVVLDGFKGKYAYLNDPARGNVRVTMEEFDDSFTGVVMFFEPSDEFTPSGKKKSMTEYAFKRLKGAGTAVAFVVLSTIIASIIGTLNPIISRFLIDKMLGNDNPQWLMLFMGMFAVLSISMIIVEWIQAIYNLRINGKLAVVGSSSYFWKVLHLPMEFFSQRLAGDIQMRQRSNETIAKQMVDTFAPLVLKSIMMVVYLTVMIRYSIMLTCVGIVSIFVNLYMSRVIAKKRVNITRVMMRDEGKLASTTLAGIEMVETIKASGAENGYFEKWSGYQASVNFGETDSSKLNNYLGMVPQFVVQLTDLIVVFIGVILTYDKQFTIGMITAFQGFLALFTEPAMSLVEAGQTLQEMRTDVERIEDVMSYPTDEYCEEASCNEDDEYAKLTGRISIKNLSFGYSKLAPPLIKDFNLELYPGKSVAFVGTSGCGKSTLSKLISGLYKPWDGTITYDGKARGEINRNVFTGSLAVVDQDITMFEDSIAANIKMWDNSIEDFEMIMAANDAQVHDMIVQRKDGYNYKITEGGKDFSGGERQRLELARVLAQDPTIIILDEATSALDAKTEYEVVKAIKDRGITCIVVAHRLSTIRHCDEIIVLENGDVVERGTHDELYAKGGKYTELVVSE